MLPPFISAVVWASMLFASDSALCMDTTASPVGPPDGIVRLLAVGDINLGRKAGQILLRGDTLYPFAAVRDTFARFDLVFGNLECPVSEQGGETEHPRNNIIFTAPPVAAWSLHRAGVTVVSTANNHALDYGPAAVGETLDWLDSVGVASAGTCRAAGDPFAPAVLVRNGVRCALFAVTTFVNDSPRGWDRVVAPADTGMLFPRMRVWQDSVDFLILSYHGGVEYAERPSPETRWFARRAVDAGADLVLGHHPHVPHGLEMYRGALIVHSLGNFVFRQPGRFWTRHGIAVDVTLARSDSSCRVESVRVLPVAADFQPSFLVDGPDAEKVLARVRALTTDGTKEFVAW